MVDIQKLYDDLLDVFLNKSYDEYIKECNKLNDYIKNNPKIKDIKYKPFNNFIPYPDNDDKDFNKKIFQKKEFNKSKAENEENINFEKKSLDMCKNKIFKLTQNQKFIKNFISPLTPYNGLLLYHGVGVGKTCTAISIAEQYHELYQQKILVILSSALIDNFKKQLFDITKYDIKTNTSTLCTGTTYPDLIIDKYKLDPISLEKKIKQIINDRYQFIGYKELAISIDNLRQKIMKTEKNDKKIDRLLTERLSVLFSNRLLIIDEAHNLRNPTETGKKQISVAFKTLLKHVINVKLILLTATPMYNNAKEIIWTLNLLLANDKRPELTTNSVFDKNDNLTEAGKQRIIDASRGYISYMRGENPFGFPFRLYPSINNDKNLLKVYPKKDIYGSPITIPIEYLEIITSNMSDYQKKIYDSFKIKAYKETNSEIVEEEEEDEDLKINNELQIILQISNIVYPNIKNIPNIDSKELYGNNGFNSCFTKEKDKITYIVKENQFLSYDLIDTYAPKIKTIIDYIINSKGIVFIYSRYYTSGIIPLAIALEHIGFMKYGNSNITRNIDVNDKFNGSKPKYIILSRRKDLSPNNDNEINISKKINNLYGEEIKVIIVTKVGTEGIDFKRIREIHLMEPWFNLNRIEQIIGRGVRFCSHIDLPKEERNVTIMFHSTHYSSEEESIDLRTYRIAEIKQKKIIEIETILKETSIDCNLNKNNLLFPVDTLNIKFDIETSQKKLIKNYKVGDKDNSFICGFSKCKAVCSPNIDSKLEVDESTFNTHFINDDIDYYIKLITELYINKIYYSYEKLLKLLRKQYTKIDEETLLYALEHMIDNKYPIINENNISGYLIYSGNKYIFHPNHIRNKRITIEERKIQFKKRLRVPLKGLDKQISPIKSKTIEKEETNIIQKLNTYYNQNIEIIYQIIIDSYISDLEIKDISEFLLSTNVHIQNYIDKNYKKLDKSIKTISNKISKIILDIEQFMIKLDNSIIDSIIDKLTLSEFISLVELLSKKYNTKKELSIMENKYLSSLILGFVLYINEKTNTVQFFYNYFEKELFCYRDNGNFSKCNYLDTGSETYKKYLSLININKEKGLNNDILAYISVKNNIELLMKMRDSNKTIGSVCNKTSSLKIDDVIEKINKIMIKKIYNSSSLIKKNKNNLCYLYEIIMRTFKKENFQRPFFI